MPITVPLPPDVADRLKEVSRITGLPPRDTASMLLALVLGREPKKEPCGDS